MCHEQGTNQKPKLERENQRSSGLICPRRPKYVNQTDPDCRIIKSIQGKHAGYNVQSVVDDKHGLIVHTEAIAEVNDRNQFALQINQANEVLEQPCKVACADAGYCQYR